MNKLLAFVVVILSLLVLLLGGYVVSERLGLWGAADKPSQTPKTPETATTPVTPDPAAPVTPTTPVTPDPAAPVTPTEPVLAPWPGTASSPFGVGIVFSNPNLQFSLMRINYVGLNNELASMTIDMDLKESDPKLGAWWKRGVQLYYSVDGENISSNSWPIKPQITQKGSVVTFAFARVPVEALYTNPARGAVGIVLAYSSERDGSLAFAVNPPDRELEKSAWDKAQKEAAENAPAIAAPTPAATTTPAAKKPVAKKKVVTRKK